MEFINLSQPLDFNDIEEIIKDFRSGVLKQGDKIKLCGFVHRIRQMSGFAFVIIRTSRILVQCICSSDIEQLTEESTVLINGRIAVDERSKLGFEIHIDSYTILSKPAAQTQITINKKELTCSLDTNLDNRAIALRNPNQRAIFKIEAGILQSFRTFFHDNGFTEITPPIIVSAGAEGGSDMFSLDYFGKEAYLNQSPQVYKQMMVGVFSRVFAVSPVFRAEKHSTARHINEFRGLDFEMGFINSFEDIMAMEGKFISYLYDVLNEKYKDELEELSIELPKIESIPKIRFAEIKNIIADKYKREYRDVNDLEPEEERLIGKYFLEEFNSPLVFVTHYPTKKRPFYTMDDPEDPNYTLSFDLLLNGAEITTGGQRIHDYRMQTAKMEKLNMNIEDFSDYLSIHKYGMPPHGGLGIGLERFAMRLLKLDNIRLATAFPRDINRLRP